MDDVDDEMRRDLEDALWALVDATTALINALTVYTEPRPQLTVVDGDAAG